MRWNFCVGFAPKEVKQWSLTLVYDLTDYINFLPSVQFVFRMPVNYTDISVLDLFKFNAGADATKQLDRRNSMEPSHK